MTDVYHGSSHWWECPQCKQTIGKPKNES